MLLHTRPPPRIVPAFWRLLSYRRRTNLPLPSHSGGRSVSINPSIGILPRVSYGGMSKSIILFLFIGMPSLLTFVSVSILYGTPFSTTGLLSLSCLRLLIGRLVGGATLLNPRCYPLTFSLGKFPAFVSLFGHRPRLLNVLLSAWYPPITPH